MGEIATTVAAFNKELNKALLALPRVTPGLREAHDANQAHYRALLSTRDVLQHFTPRLPHSVVVPMLLERGAQLLRSREYELALRHCYQHILALGLVQPDYVDGKPAYPAPQRLQDHLLAMLGKSECESKLALLHDVGVRHPDTLVQLLQTCEEVKAAIDLSASEASLYWIVHNAAILMHDLCLPLTVASYARQTLPFLLHATLAMESSAALRHPRFLAWRATLVVAVCRAYDDLGAFQLAQQFCERTLAQVSAIKATYALDPVPPAPEITAAVADAEQALRAVVAQYALRGAASETAARQTLESGGVAEDAASVATLLDAVASTPFRAAQQEEASAHLAGSLASLSSLITPKVEAALGILQGRAERDARAAAQERADAAHADDATDPAEKADEDRTAAEDEEAARKLTDAATLLPLSAHLSALCTAYHFKQSELFEKLVRFAQGRVGPHGDLKPEAGTISPREGSADDDAVPSVRSASSQDLLAAADVLQALLRISEPASSSKLSSGEGQSVESTQSAAFQALADALDRHAASARVLPDLLTDAAVALWTAARPLLDGVFCARDKEAALVQRLLASCHTALQAADADDPELRLQIAIKLALLLSETGDDFTARDVLLAAAALADRARGEANLALSSAPDERYRHITASRSQPLDSSARLVSEMSAREATLAHLHSDVVLQLCRAELRVGLQEQAELSERRVAKRTTELSLRKDQVKLFGTLTQTEERRLTGKVVAAGTTPTNPVAKERTLMLQVNKNPYHKALLLIQMAPLHSDVNRRSQLLQDAAEQLHACEDLEVALFEMACPHLPASMPHSKPARKSSRPRRPLLLNRTATTLVVSHHSFSSMRGGSSVASFAVYAKPFGAGVQLSANKTATEYEGTGELTPIGGRVTVRGLRPNDTYMFAVAAYDRDGKPVGDLGETSLELPIALPLPLYSAWGTLQQMASRLNLLPVARTAALTLFSHFTVATPRRALWSQNPADALQLHAAHTRSATPQLLRAYVLSVFMYTDRLLALLPARPPHSDTAPYVEEQLQRLTLTKRLVLALQTAVYVPDEQLVLEGVVRVHNALAPLLAMPHRSSFLLKALMSTHTALSTVRNVIQDSLEGQEGLRATAASASGVLSMHAYALAARDGESAHASAVAAIRAPLLVAYDTRMETPGRKAQQKRVLVELEAMQELLLQQPEVQSVDSVPLKARLADPQDLVAAVLSRLESEPIDAIWTSLQSEQARAHPRWMELCTRTMEAAAKRGFNVDFAAWTNVLRTKWMEAGKVDELAFRRLGVEGQMEFCPAVELTAEETEEVRANVAVTTGVQEVPDDSDDFLTAVEARKLQQKRRDAAARILQSRMPAYLAKRKERQALAAKRANGGVWLARCYLLQAQLAMVAARAWVDERLKAATETREEAEDTSPATVTKPAAATESSPVLHVLQLLARAANLAARGSAWLVLVNIVTQAWNAMRSLLNRDASLLAPHPRAQWQQRDEQVSGEAEGDPQPLWCYKARPSTIMRTLRSICAPLVYMLESMQSGDVVLHPFVIPMAEESGLGVPGFTLARPKLPGAPESVAVSESNFTMGSDRPRDFWFLQEHQLNFDWLNDVFLAAVSALSGGGCASAAVNIGAAWAHVSEGAYDTNIMPMLVSAAARAGENVQPFAAALSLALRDRKGVLCQLDDLRRRTAALLGGAAPLPLAAEPDTRITKAKGDGHAGAGAAKAGSVRSVSTTGRGGPQSDARLVDAYRAMVVALRDGAEKPSQILACNELGDLLAHLGSIEDAAVAWCDAIDLLLGPYQVVRHWRNDLDLVGGEELLRRYGARGLLFAGGVVCGKLARVAYPRNGHLRVESAALGAHLVAGVFACSVTHPQRAIDFAGYTPVEIWEGFDLFDNAYALNARDLLEGLGTIARVMLAFDKPLQALPVIALWEWAARSVARSVQETVRARLARVEALCLLGQPHAALSTLGKLMHGTELPDADSPRDLAFSDSSGAPVTCAKVPAYDAAATPGAPGNAEALAFIMQGGVPAVVAKLYGHWACAHVAIARARVLALLGRVRYLWRATHPLEGRLLTSDDAPPELVEVSLLERAAELLMLVVDAGTKGEAVVQEPAAAEPAGKGKDGSKDKGKGKGGAKDKDKGKGAGKDKAGDPAASPQAPQAASDAEVHACHAWQVEAVTCARLELARVYSMLWLPAQGLHHTHAALDLIKHAMPRLKDAGESACDRDTLIVGPERWLHLALVQARLYVELGDVQKADTMTETILDAARSAKDQRAVTLALAVAARVASMRGDAAAALTTYVKVQSARAKLGETDTATAAILMEHGDLRDRLGLRADAAALWGMAEELLRGIAVDLGLREEQAAPELRNVYATWRNLFIEAQVRTGRAAARCGDAEAALAKLDAAKAVMPFTRGLPAMHADVELMRGRLLRWTADAKGDCPDALHALQRAATWAAAEMGATAVQLRHALLEGSLLHAEPGACKPRGKAGSGGDGVQPATISLIDALLRCARRVAAADATLRSAPRSFGGPSMDALPRWAADAVNGSVAAHRQTSATPQQPPDASELGVVAMYFFGAIADPRPAPTAEHGWRRSAQLCELHNVLCAAVAKYKDSCAVPTVPALCDDKAAEDPNQQSANTLAALPLGHLAVQWLVEDGVKGRPSTLAADGCLAREITATDILSLPAQRRYASMVYVAIATTAASSEEQATARRALSGALVMDVQWAREVLDRVRETRCKLEIAAHGRSPELLEVLGHPGVEEGPPSSEMQLDLLTDVVKLLWRVSKGDEADPDIKYAVLDKLSNRPVAPSAEGAEDAPQDSGAAEDQASPETPLTTLKWPELTIDFWKKVEALLDDASGIVVDNEDGFTEWFVTVLDNRPAVDIQPFDGYEGR